jgi:hypothetical protein
MTEQQQQVDPQLGAPPAPPANSQEARTRLDALIADKDWGAKALAGDLAANRELRELTTMAARDDGAGVDVAMLGNANQMPTTELQVMAHAAASMREVGIREEIIRDALSGKAMTQAEVDLTKAWQTRHFADPEWSKRFLAGGAEERQQFMLCSIILSSPIKGDVYSGWKAPAK